jgi:hypothetical protein
VGISKEQTYVGSNDIPGRMNSSAGDLHRGKFAFGSFKPFGNCFLFWPLSPVGEKTFQEASLSMKSLLGKSSFRELLRFGIFP